MKEIELRIGNYVSYNGFACEVLGVVSPQPHNDKRFDNKAVLDLFDGAGIITATIEEVSPITLTEETLKGLGFHNDSLLEDKNCLSIRLKSFKVVWCGYLCLLVDGVLIPLQDASLDSVHHLQNLVYSLEGHSFILA